MKTLETLPEPHPRDGLLGGLEREMVELGELNGPTAIKLALIRHGYEDGRMEWREMTGPLPRPAIEPVVEMPAAVQAAGPGRIVRHEPFSRATVLRWCVAGALVGLLIVELFRLAGRA